MAPPSGDNAKIKVRGRRPAAEMHACNVIARHSPIEPRWALCYGRHRTLHLATSVALLTLHRILLLSFLGRAVPCSLH